MPQSLTVALIGGLFTLAVAVIGLIGVIIKTAVDFKQGKRGGDIAQAGVGVQQQTIDVSRIEKLFTENEELRKEIRNLWQANRDLRQEFETAETLHKCERGEWAEKERGYVARIDAQSVQIAADAKDICRLKEILARSEEEARFALAAQERAEGGLYAAQKVIAGLCPPGS